MTEPESRIDFANLPAPAEGFLATLFITVRSVAGLLHGKRAAKRAEDLPG